MTSDRSLASFDRGLVELEKYIYQLDDAALPRALDAFRSAAAVAPDVAAHWAALGFVLDVAGLADDALEALRHAAELDPEDHVVEVFVLTLLSESGAEREAMAGIRAAADRRGVDLGALRRDVSDAGMPVESRTLILNGFVRARNFLKSRLEDEIERAERRRNPAAWEARKEAERLECLLMQDELRRSIDPRRVPAAFSEVTSWASRLGIGDDFCRGWLAERLTDDERLEVQRTVSDHALVVQEWLDGFDPASMSAEAAAFMYLLLSVEEMCPGA